MKNYRFRENNDAVTVSMGFSHIGNLIRHVPGPEATPKSPTSPLGVYTDCGMWSDTTATKGEADASCGRSGTFELSIEDHGKYFEKEILTEMTTLKYPSNHKTVAKRDQFIPLKCDLRED